MGSLKFLALIINSSLVGKSYQGQSKALPKSQSNPPNKTPSANSSKTTSQSQTKSKSQYETSISKSTSNWKCSVTSPSTSYIKKDPKPHMESDSTAFWTNRHPVFLRSVPAQTASMIKTATHFWNQVRNSLTVWKVNPKARTRLKRLKSTRTNFKNWTISTAPFWEYQTCRIWMCSSKGVNLETFRMTWMTKWESCSCCSITYNVERSDFSASKNPNNFFLTL